MRGRRNWYSMLVAVLCGAMAGLPMAVAAPAGAAAGAPQAASGGDNDASAARRPAATRIDPFDDFSNYLGGDDAPSAIEAGHYGGLLWGAPASSIHEIAFDLPARFGLVRDGLTRGPPSA
jgi:hypothetical protein